MDAFWLLAFLLAVTGDALRLPENLRDHLDKSSPFYTTTLKPWDFTLDTSPVEDSLRFVIGVFRHGNRPPSFTYEGNKYPYNDRTFWPEGPKQLTEYGKNQLYRVGERLKARYSGYLSDFYDPQEIRVVSNPVDRNYMSAACLLAGLYPPHDFQVWNEDIPWQPIPIWQLDSDLSKVATDDSICPEFYKEMMEAVYEVNTYNSDQFEILTYLHKQTGLNVTNLSDIYIYWEILRLQDERGYGIPEWAIPIYPDEISNIHATVMTALSASTPNMIKLIAGPAMAKYAEILRSIRDGEKTGWKLYLESAHETTINSLMPAYGFMEPFIVDTSSLLLLELHEKPEGYFTQLLYYKNDKEDYPEILQMRNCDNPCPLERMLQIMDQVSPQDWENECKIN